MWILTNEYNAYDQFGKYFIAAWSQKPGKEEIAQVCKIDTTGRFTNSDETIDHILSGGGRTKNEDHWFNLEEVREGEHL
jgi:hypothetical protein